MTEKKKTAAHGALALILLLGTWATTARIKPLPVFAERGSLLFPQFQDPNAAASLEVIEFDTLSASVRAFKVQNRDGHWTITSAYEYPADAKDQLAQTVASLITLRRDDFATENAADYESCGVLDPLDLTRPGLKGRGTRLVVRAAHGQVLADVIIGNRVEGHPAFRYIREPNQRRVYTSNVGDVKISTAFSDWIERDLLDVAVDEIDAVNLRNYSLDRTAGRTNPGETMLLQKTRAGEWTLNGLGANEQLQAAALDDLLRNLAGLRIAGVAPKPPRITAALSGEVTGTSMSREDRVDLVSKGFYLAPSGQLVSEHGEIVVRTNRGVYYTVRVGGIATGNAPGDGRYIFITVDFDRRSASTPERAIEGEEKMKLLRTRFAPWYYIIDGDTLAKIRLGRKDLVRPRLLTR